MDINKITSDLKLSELESILVKEILSPQSPSASSEQAKMLLNLGMIGRLIAALNTNSTSADKLAGRLNILTRWIGIATGVGACVSLLAGIHQLFK